MGNNSENIINFDIIYFLGTYKLNMNIFDIKRMIFPDFFAIMEEERILVEKEKNDMDDYPDTE